MEKTIQIKFTLDELIEFAKEKAKIYNFNSLKIKIIGNGYEAHPDGGKASYHIYSDYGDKNIDFDLILDYNYDDGLNELTHEDLEVLRIYAEYYVLMQKEMNKITGDYKEPVFMYIYNVKKNFSNLSGVKIMQKSLSMDKIEAFRILKELFHNPYVAPAELEILKKEENLKDVRKCISDPTYLIETAHKLLKRRGSNMLTNKY